MSSTRTHESHLVVSARIQFQSVVCMVCFAWVAVDNIYSMQLVFEFESALRPFEIPICMLRGDRAAS